MLCFHFHSVQNTLFPFCFLLLTHGLLSHLFNFHTKCMFPNFLLLLISNWIPLWSENILWMISIFFNLVKVILCLTYSLWENILWALEKTVYFAFILLLLGKVLYWCLLDLGALYCCSVFYFLVGLLPSCSARYWMWKIEDSNYYWSVTYFTLQLCQFALYVFFGSVVKCIFVYNCL